MEALMPNILKHPIDFPFTPFFWLNFSTKLTSGNASATHIMNNNLYVDQTIIVDNKATKCTRDNNRTNLTR
jgi:hypothetical protein